MSLKRHDKGTEVKKLQKALIDLGYPLPRWGVDGDLGNETMEAVDKLLTSHGLDYGGLTDNDEISINDLNFIYALLKKKPAPLPVAKDMFFDRRSVSSRAHIQRRRTWQDVTGICLHQTACVLGERPARWDTIGCHVGITRTGKVIWLHDFDFNVAHGGLWNTHTVGIEMDGLYEGILGNPKTLWDDPETKEREKATFITPETVSATKNVIRWICAEVARHDGAVMNLVAHRQSSSSRENDPGSGLWQAVALPMHKELGLSDGGLGFKLGSGYAIPEAWDPRCKGYKY